MRGIGKAIAIFVVAGVVDPGKATAQAPPPPPSTSFRVRGALDNDIGAAPGADLGDRAAIRNGFRLPNPFPPYPPGPYYPPYVDPYGGFTSGLADMMSAQGQSLIQIEQARMLNEQTKQARIDTRRKNFDEWLYERDKTPTIEDERERQRIEAIRRSRNDPPIGDITSAVALNQLLKAIQQMDAKQIRGPSVPLDPDAMRHINVTSGATEGSLGVLRDGGRLSWPLPLRMSAFDDDRMKLDQLAPQAYAQAQTGRVTANVLEGMIEAEKNMQATIKRNIASITPSDYSKAKVFLRDLEGAIQTLQDPNVAKYATGQWSADARTVAELVQQMTLKGLQFAPAVPGDQAAYVALHRAMVAYYAGPEVAANWDPLRK